MKTLYLHQLCPQTNCRVFREADGYVFDQPTSLPGWIRVIGKGYQAHFPPSSVRLVLEEGSPATEVAATFVAATQPVLDADVDAGGPERATVAPAKKRHGRNSTRG